MDRHAVPEGEPDWTDPLCRRLLDAMPDAILLIDEAGIIRVANPEVEQVFGYHPDELAGQAIELLIPVARRAVHVPMREAFSANPHRRPMTSGLELEALHRDGHVFPAEVALSPLRIGGRSMTLASARDVSASIRTRQVEVLARYNAHVAELGKLALNCESADELFENLAAIVVRAFEFAQVRLYRRVEGSSAPTLKRFAPNGGQADEATDDPSIALTRREGAPVLIEDFERDARFSRPNDAPAAPSAPSCGLNAPVMLDGRVQAVIALRAPGLGRFRPQDASFLMSLCHIVATALHRLDSQNQVAHLQRLESLGQLTGGIAHDFNNLLAIVSGNLQILEEGCVSAPERSRAIAAVRHAVERGSALTGKLLAFARRQPLSATTVDVRRVVTSLVQMLQRTLGPSITLQASMTGEALYCRADPGQFENALINLAVNARDAMPSGGTLEISGTLGMADAEELRHDPGLHAGPFVVLEVSDTGQGIAPEHLPHVFEPFFTTKGAGKGTGLGLSMVYGFARQSGGYVTLTTEPERGTSVRIHLPAVAAHGTQPVDRPATPEHGKESILVVEDDQDVRAVAVHFLRRFGYEVTECADAAGALQILQQRPIALLFSDVDLGKGPDGLELARLAQQRFPALKVLLTSGHAPAIDHADRAHLIDRLLRKPYRREDLAESVQRALEAG